MAHRKTFFVLILFFMCLLVYILNYSLNLSNTDQLFQLQEQYRYATHIKKIVATPSNRLQKVSESCPETYEPKKIAIQWNKNWQKSANESKLFLLSAYVDNRLRNNTSLRIIGLSKGKFSQKIFCRIWYKNTSSVTEIHAQELWISSWDYATPEKYYRPLLLSCPSTSTPVAVSVIHEPCQEPKNIFRLNSPKQLIKRDFGICLKLLHFQQDITPRLVEWLELQFLLGADAISVYKYHLHPHIADVLEKYASLGKLSIKDYVPPEGDLLTTSLWQKRRHEMVIYNDCFYSRIHNHNYIVNLDLDEAIMPMIHATWKDLLHHAMIVDPRLTRTASLSAQNVYFFDSFPEDMSVPTGFHMLRHQHRSDNFTPPGFAQKSFFASNLSLSVSNHYALRSLYPGQRTNGAIGKDLAHLHHYRAGCPPKMDKECENNYMKFWVKDPVILKFKKKLMKNVELRIKEIKLDVNFQ